MVGHGAAGLAPTSAPPPASACLRRWTEPTTRVTLHPDGMTRLGAAAAASGGVPSSPEEAAATATLVLVHGSLHGGWCWRRVTPLPRAAGREVSAPARTGLGERVPLARPAIGLDTHIRDVRGLCRLASSSAALAGQASFVSARRSGRMGSPAGTGELLYPTAPAPSAIIPSGLEL
jgi:hypothetical protein